MVESNLSGLATTNSLSKSASSSSLASESSESDLYLSLGQSSEQSHASASIQNKKFSLKIVPDSSYMEGITPTQVAGLKLQQGQTTSGYYHAMVEGVPEATACFSPDSKPTGHLENQRVHVGATQLVQYIGERLSQAIQKNVEVRSFFASDPLTLPEAQILHQAPLLMNGVEHAYLPEGCQARAFLLKEKSNDYFGDNAAAFVVLQSEEKISAEHGNFYVEWSYHVALAIQSEQGDLYVLDPASDRQSALLLSDWAARFSYGANVTVIVAPANRYFTNAGMREDILNISLHILNQNSIYMTNYKRKLLDAYQYSSSIHPIACYVYGIGSQDAGMRFSLTYSNVAWMNEDNYWINPCELSIRLKNGEKIPLFWSEENGQLAPLDKNQAIAKLRDLGIKRVQLLQVPCKLSDSNEFKVIA